MLSLLFVPSVRRFVCCRSSGSAAPYHAVLYHMIWGMMVLSVGKVRGPTRIKRKVCTPTRFVILAMDLLSEKGRSQGVVRWLMLKSCLKRGTGGYVLHRRMQL
jgi:hypothetical protein